MNGCTKVIIGRIYKSSIRNVFILFQLLHLSAFGYALETLETLIIFVKIFSFDDVFAKNKRKIFKE